MNILDLAYKYDLKIDFDGDFDRGCYHMAFTYITATQSDITDITEKLSVKQHDIDELYLGVKKLLKILDEHVSEGY
jgi:hypothetical protein